MSFYSIPSVIQPFNNTIKIEQEGKFCINWDYIVCIHIYIYIYTYIHTSSEAEACMMRGENGASTTVAKRREAMKSIQKYC